MCSETLRIAEPPFQRGAYRRPGSCDRSGAVGVVMLAVLCLMAALWQWASRESPTSRPAPTLAVFDVAPAAEIADAAPPTPNAAVEPEPVAPPSPAPIVPDPAAPAMLAPPAPVAPLASAVAPASVAPRSAAAPLATVPIAGRSPASERAARANWQGDILAHLKPLLRYPRIAEREEQQGIVLVAITVDRRGVVRAARIARGSGYPLLDGEALATLRRGSPLPPPTADIPGDPVSVELPIQFALAG